MRLANIHTITIATDPTYTTSGLVSCAERLLLMYFDVFFFEIVRFCTMLSNLSCNACGVIVVLVSIQVQVHGPARVLLNEVGLTEVIAFVGVLKALEMVDIICEDKTVVVVVLHKALVVVGVLEVVVVVGEDITLIMVDVFKMLEVVKTVE